MAKEKQQWLGLSEDEARWLRGHVYSIGDGMRVSAEATEFADHRFEWRKEQERCEEFVKKMDNLLLLFPRRASRKEK